MDKNQAFYVPHKDSKYDKIRKEINESKHLLGSHSKVLKDLNYNLLSKYILDEVHINDFSGIKKILQLINYSLFLHENQVNKAFVAISKVNTYHNASIKHLLFSELIRLNIWALINEGKDALQDKYNKNKQYEFLQLLLHDSPFTIYGAHKNFLPHSLRLEIKNALNQQLNYLVAIQDVTQYIVQNHEKLQQQVIDSLINPKKILQDKRPDGINISSDLVLKGMQDNDSSAVQAGFNLAKSHILSRIKKNPHIKSDFFSMVHEALVSRPLSNVNPEILNRRILYYTSIFDLFLISLRPSLCILTHNPKKMYDCLQSLLNQSNVFYQIGIDISLKRSITDFSPENLMTALYLFVFHIKQDRDYIANRMITKMIL